MDPVVHFFLSAILVIFPYLPIFVEVRQYDLDWTRTISSSFVPQFLLPPSFSSGFDINAFQYAYKLDESLLNSLDRYSSADITHPLANLFHGVYDTWVPEQPPFGMVVHYALLGFGLVVGVLLFRALFNAFNGLDRRFTHLDEVDEVLSSTVDVPSIVISPSPSEPSKTIPSFNSSGLFCADASDTLVPCSVPLAKVDSILPPTLSQPSLADEPSSVLEQASLDPQLPETEFAELEAMVFADPDTLSPTMAFGLPAQMSPEVPSPDIGSHVVLASEGPNSSADSSFSSGDGSEMETDVSAQAESPACEESLVQSDTLVDGSEATQLVDKCLPEHIDDRNEIGILCPNRNDSTLALVPWTASTLLLPAATPGEDSEVLSSANMDFFTANVSSEPCPSMLTEGPVMDSGSAICQSLAVIQHQDSCLDSVDNEPTDCDLPAVHSPVIELVSPQAIVEDDLLDFDSDLYEPSADFPMMHLDGNLSDYLDDDVDDWGWTLINIRLNESKCFVFTGHTSRPTDDTDDDSVPVNTDSCIMDDSVPVLYFSSIWDVNSRDHRRAYSEPAFSSLPFITRAEVEPTPILDSVELRSRFTDVALRLGIIPHDQAFRLYEPAEELALAIREEKRALAIAARPRPKKGKLPLYIRKFGLDREAFFAIFQRPLPPPFISYADALRINARLSRGLTVTVAPEQVARRERSATVSAKSFVHVNRNRGGQDQNINGDELIAKKPIVRRDSSCAPRQRTRTQSGPKLPSSKGQDQPADCSSPSSAQETRTRSRTRSGSLQSNAANHDDTPRLRLRTTSAGPDLSLSVVRYSAATAAAAPPSSHPAPQRVRRRESAPCISRPPALSTILGSPTLSPPAISVPVASPSPAQLLRHGAGLSLGVRMPGAQVRQLVLPAASFARIDDEGALDDVPQRIVDGAVVRQNAAASGQARIPSWVSM
ncbi:hypothetical protein EIP86_000251 [Pleurotus ostreatoroseus]|nr:hypothetical protein EIP86_000251 [Pleurotus ostreatoroseus]